MGTYQGLASSTLALMVAALAGVLIVVRPEWGVAALTLTFFLSYPEALQGSGRLTINNVLGLVLAALLAMRIGLERRADFLGSRPIQFSLLIAFALLVNNVLVDQVPALPGLPDTSGSIPRVQELLTRTAYLIFFVAFLRRRWQILVLVWLVVGCVLLTVPSAIWHAVTATGGATETAREAGRAAASFGINIAKNANRLSFLCLMAISVIGHVLPESRHRATRLAGLSGIAVLVVTIFLSASRSGLIGLVTLFGIFVMRRGSQRRLVLSLLVALTVAVGISLVLVPEQNLDRITNFFQTEHGEEGAGSTRARLQLLRIGLKMFADNPVLGVGVGDFRQVSTRDYGNWGSALHNSYLLTLVEGGLVLFVPYMLLFWSLWREIKETQRLADERSRPHLAWLVAAVRGIFILFLIFSLFADVWHELFPYLITGLIVTIGHIYRQDAERSTA